MKTRKRGGSLSLAYYKYKLEGKVDYGSGFYCDRVEFLKLNTHTFLVLHGNDGVPNDTMIDGIKCCDDPTNNLTYYYLMTKNMLSPKPRCEDDSFLCKRTRVRFRNKPFSSVYVEHAYNSPTAKTCIAVCINDTKKEAEILNIRVNEKRCFIPNMDSTMKLIMELLEEVEFKGKVILSDHATKDGMSVAIHVMKHKPYFSKYQDYGFEIQEQNIPRLKEIKEKIQGMSVEDANEEFQEEVGDLLESMYRIL